MKIRMKDRREGRRRNKKTCILGKHMKHIEGGKTLGTNFFRHFQVPRSRFPFGNHFNLHALVSRYPKIHKGMGASSISISPVPMIPPSSCYTRCSTNTFNIVSYSWMEKDQKSFHFFETRYTGCSTDTQPFTYIRILSFLYYLENYLFEIDIFVSFIFHFPSVWKILIS